MCGEPTVEYGHSDTAGLSDPIYMCHSCSTKPRPEVVCLCGSTRFFEEFAYWNLFYTLAGKVVLSIGCDTKNVDAHYTLEQKRQLDWLHKWKITMADRVVVINPNNYIGESTRSEIDYAKLMNKRIEYVQDQVS